MNKQPLHYLIETLRINMTKKKHTLRSNIYVGNKDQQDNVNIKKKHDYLWHRQSVRRRTRRAAGKSNALYPSANLSTVSLHEFGSSQPKVELRYSVKLLATAALDKTYSSNKLAPPK